MSLEQAIADLGNKFDELISLTKREIELREQGLEFVSKAGEKAGVTKKETKAAEPKAEKAEKVVEPEQKAEASTDLIEQAKTKVAEYMAGATRPEERKARSAKIKKLLNNEKVKKPDVTEQTTSLADVQPSAMNAVIKQIDKYIAAGDITQPEASEDDGLDLDD